MQVIDSSTARRRGGAGPVVEGFQQPSSSSAGTNGAAMAGVGDDNDNDDVDDGGKGEKSHWPKSGIGMDEQFNETVQPSGAREFLPANTKSSREGSKWDKLIPDKKRNTTWVRPSERGAPASAIYTSRVGSR